tara:strand:- start:1174 stop:1530 length:357 start_codon:yes stop_codon:yes gene_type:complete
MAQIDIQIQNINESVAIDDIVYYSSVNPTFQGGGHLLTSGQLHEIGPIISITPNVGITVDNTISGNVPANGDFLMFSKDKTVNTSGLAGYYASVTFKNNDYQDARIFSVASEIEISSK